MFREGGPPGEGESPRNGIVGGVMFPLAKSAEPTRGGELARDPVDPGLAAGVVIVEALLPFNTPYDPDGGSMNAGKADVGEGATFEFVVATERLVSTNNGGWLLSIHPVGNYPSLAWIMNSALGYPNRHGCPTG